MGQIVDMNCVEQIGEIRVSTLYDTGLAASWILYNINQTFCLIYNWTLDSR